MCQRIKPRFQGRQRSIHFEMDLNKRSIDITKHLKSSNTSRQRNDDSSDDSGDEEIEWHQYM